MTSATRYRRILLKLSGEALMGSGSYGIDMGVCGALAEDIRLFGGPEAADLLVFPESMPDHRDMRETFAASSDRLTVLSRLRALRSPRRSCGERAASDRPSGSSLSHRA